MGGREDSVPRTTEFYSCLIHHCYPGPNFLIKPTPLHPAIELVLQYLHVTYSSFFLLLLHLHSSSNLQLLLSSYNQSSYTQFQRHHTPTETIWQKSPSIASATPKASTISPSPTTRSPPPSSPPTENLNAREEQRTLRDAMEKEWCESGYQGPREESAKMWEVTFFLEGKEFLCGSIRRVA